MSLYVSNQSISGTSALGSIGNFINQLNTSIISMQTNLNITGSSTLQSSLTVSGVALLNSTMINQGAVTNNSSLTVSGSTVLNNSLTVSGLARLNSTLLNLGAVTNNSSLIVSGATTLNSTLNVIGTANISTIASNTTTSLTLNSNNTGSLGEIVLQKGGATYGTIQNANSNFNLQLMSETGISLDTKANGNIHIAANGTGFINLITGTPAVSRAQITADGILCNNLSNLGNNNTSITSFWSGANPAIIFNTNAYDNTSVSGRYGYINTAGWVFTDGNSGGDTQTCGVNNLGFYLPTCGYLLTGQRFNARVNASPVYTSTDFVMYPNAGGNVCLTQLIGTGTRTVSAGPNGVLYISTSDERLKKNKTTLPPVLEKLLALNPITYDWDENSDMKKHPAFNDEIQYGFTAQNIQSQFPGLVYDVTISDTTYLGYEDRRLFPILVKGIQEQNQIIVNQQKQIDNQQKQIDNQQKQIDELKLLVNQLINK